MTARLVMAAAIGLAAVALAGCGGDTGGTEAGQSPSHSHEIHSGVVDGAIELTFGPHDPEQGVESRISFSGPFESGATHELPDFDLDVGLEESPQGTVDFGLIATADAGYIDFDDQGYEINQAVFDRLSSAKPVSELHPTRWIVNPSNEGHEEVDGTETIHTSGEANVERIIPDLAHAAEQLGLRPGRLDARQRDFDRATLDLFTGAEDGILRRLDLGLAWHGRSEDAGPFDANFNVSLTVSDVNEPQQIEAPEDAAPIGELVPKLPFQLSGLGEFVSGKTTSGGP